MTYDLPSLAADIRDGESLLAELRIHKDRVGSRDDDFQRLTHDIRRTEPQVSYLKRTFQAAVVKELARVAGVDGGTPAYDLSVTEAARAQIAAVAEEFEATSD